MTAAPWLPEREVPPEEARQLIRACFPALAATRVEHFGEGWDNVAYLIDDTYVFRFPRRQLGADLMATEIRVMPGVAGLLPLPTSAPAFIGRPSATYPWPFAGYRVLPGHPLYRASFGLDQRHRAAVPLARFLAALHAISAEQAASLGAGPDPLGRFDITRRTAKARESIARLTELGLLGDAAPLFAILDRALAEGMPAEWTPVLVHADLDTRHILVDDGGQITGIIDWGDVHVGHRAIDLALAHAFLPPEAHGAFCHAYGSIDPMTWRLARFRALCHQAVVAGYGHDIGDTLMMREALASLAHIAVAAEDRMDSGPPSDQSGQMANRER